ncbi:MAG TPA: carboxylesterase/lipase family protein [Dehalococcoidia bacterium]|nr:carboxylesterase/lipase family protein [Dehalococcoidia bacterium]
MSEVTVDIRDGKLRGASDGGVLAFKGIPYGAPPIGARRFLPPADVEPWAGVRDALDYGPSCPQASSRPQGWAQEPRLSEDCLYLNVWTPATDGGKRPVLVWFHGGGFSIGSGSWPVYDGTALARRGDAVVVTVNHRLNIFGYLQLAGLMPAEFASSSNAGMLDLVASLEWVRDNIGAFGGDAGNVTIFGESGGGAKVSVLHTMPAARGLFHRAVIESGPGLRVKRPEAAAELSKQVLADLGISAGDVKALQALPYERLLDANAKLGAAGAFGFSPVLDGRHITEDPRDAYASGRAPDVPMIIGCNRDEATLFLARDTSIDDSYDDARLEKRMSSLGEDGGRIIEAYRASRPEASPRELLLAIESDRMMRIPSIELAERKIAGTKTPVYMYLFCWSAGPLGSAHGFEIAFVFDNARPPVMGASTGRAELASQMSEAWLAFARTGSPDHAGILMWPAYATDERATMIFDRGPAQVAADPGAGERRAWQGVKTPIGMPA